MEHTAVTGGSKRRLYYRLATGQRQRAATDFPPMGAESAKCHLVRLLLRLPG